MQICCQKMPTLNRSSLNFVISVKGNLDNCFLFASHLSPLSSRPEGITSSRISAVNREAQAVRGFKKALNYLVTTQLTQ